MLSQITRQTWALLKSVSRSFYLTLRLLPAEVRNTLALGYLLARTSDTIADTESAPLELRLQALDAFSREQTDFVPFFLPWQRRPAERLLIEQVPYTLTLLNNSPDQASLRQVIAAIIEGQRFDLLRFSAPSSLPLTSEELDRYIYLVAGCVGAFWTELCAAKIPHFSSASLENMQQWGIHFGKGLQLVNILRDRHSDCTCGRIYVPEERWAAELANARTYLAEGLQYVHALQNRRLRMACALPLHLGQKTLALLEANPQSPRVKVPRWQVGWIFMRTALANGILISP